MGYEQAYLKLEDGSKIDILFNPAEYNLSKNVSYADKKIPGLDNPFIQFISGETESLKVTLMFNTYQEANDKSAEESGEDVRRKTTKVSDLQQINPSKHRPPLVTFHYGSLNFTGVITEVNQTFTMFLGDGRPVRAKMELTFRSTERNSYLPLESPDRTKSRTIHEGQQLWHIAWEEYGDAEKWNVIAMENKLMNPLDVKPGKKLRLPAITQ